MNKELGSYESNDLNYYNKYKNTKYADFSSAGDSDSVILTKGQPHQSIGLGSYSNYNLGTTNFYTPTESPLSNNLFAKPLDEPSPFDAFAPKPKNTNIFKHDFGISNLEVGKNFFPSGQAVKYTPQTIKYGLGSTKYGSGTTVKYQAAPPKYGPGTTVKYQTAPAKYKSQSVTYSPQTIAYTPQPLNYGSPLKPISAGTDTGFGSLKIYSLDDDHLNGNNHLSVHAIGNSHSHSQYSSLPEQTTITTVNSHEYAASPEYHSPAPSVAPPQAKPTQEYETAILRFNPGTNELTISIPSQYVNSISNAYQSSTSVKLTPTPSTSSNEHSFGSGPQVTLNGDLGLQNIANSASAESPYVEYQYSQEPAKQVTYEPVYPPLSSTPPYQTSFDSSGETHTHYFSGETTQSVLPPVPQHEIQIDSPVAQQTVVPTLPPPQTYTLPHKVAPTPGSRYPYKLGNLIAHKKPGTNEVVLQMPNWHPLFNDAINAELGLKEANLPKATPVQPALHEERPVTEYQAEHTQLFHPNAPHQQYNLTNYNFKSNEVVYQPQQSEHQAPYPAQIGKLYPGKNHNIQEIINSPTWQQAANATSPAKAGSKKSFKYSSFFEVIRNAANKLTTGIFGDGGVGAIGKGGVGKDQKR